MKLHGDVPSRSLSHDGKRAGVEALLPCPALDVENALWLEICRARSPVVDVDQRIQ